MARDAVLLTPKREREAIDLVRGELPVRKSGRCGHVADNRPMAEIDSNEGRARPRADKTGKLIRGYRASD
jgi:hypothetical protein